MGMNEGVGTESTTKNLSGTTFALGVQMSTHTHI